MTEQTGRWEDVTEQTGSFGFVNRRLKVPGGWIYQFSSYSDRAACFVPDITAPVSHLNLPPLFEADDWLWVAQSLAFVPWSDDENGFAPRARMDRIIARILEYRAEDVRKERRE